MSDRFNRTPGGRFAGKHGLSTIDPGLGFVDDSCTGKTITIDNNAYKLLSSLKVGPRDSFTKVILRNIYRPLETCGEVLEAHEQLPPPNINLELLEKVLKGRGRRSGGRK